MKIKLNLFFKKKKNNQFNYKVCVSYQLCRESPFKTIKIKVEGK